MNEFNLIFDRFLQNHGISHSHKAAWLAVASLGPGLGVIKMLKLSDAYMNPINSLTFVIRGIET